jgi:hypothetical protein
MMGCRSGDTYFFIPVLRHALMRSILLVALAVIYLSRLPLVEACAASEGTFLRRYISTGTGSDNRLPIRTSSAK